MQRWLLFIAVVAAVLLADQITKHTVIDTLRVGESIAPIPALDTVFQITRSQNSGAAFGIFAQAGDLFLVIALVVTVLMIIYYARLREPAPWMRLGIALVTAGALGNALDRLEYGAVVDFIHYHIPGVISNVSNLADHAIVFGVLLIFVASWRADKARKPTATEEQPGEAS
jgi:signal peptidase II